MGADTRFLLEFSKAVEAVRHQDEADLFQRVLQIADERGDQDLATIARRYRDAAATAALKARQDTRRHIAIPDSVIELARVASRHPSHFGPPDAGPRRPPLAAV